MESEIFVTGNYTISSGEKTSKDLRKPVEKFVSGWGPKREDLGFARKLDGIYVKTEENGIYFDVTSDDDPSEPSSPGAATGGGSSSSMALKTILSEHAFKSRLDSFKEPVKETVDLSIEEAEARTIARATKYERTIMHQAIIDGNVALVRKGIELGYAGHKIELGVSTTLHLAAALGY